MSAAIVKDFMAIWQQVVVYDKVPSTIVILIDPWALNQNNQRMAWKSIASLYRDYLSGDVFQPSSSLPVIQDFGTQQMQILPLDQVQPTMQGKRGDGGYIYPLSFTRQLTIQELDQRVDEYIQGCVFSMCNWKFDHIVADGLLRLFDDFVNRKIEVFVVLPPYEKKVLDFFQQTKVYDEALQEFIRFIEQAVEARKNQKFTLCNYINPQDVGCQRLEFIDGMHYRKTCLQKILHQCIDRKKPKT
ncbi:MAG: hypothetical protein KDK51_00475 [Deltaproteobacteria bacterium]|nr:hypothetical protein [Deltaproteobacteria bacterium]